MIYIEFYISKEFAGELNKEIVRSMKILEITWQRNTLKLVLCHCQMQALANQFCTDSVTITKLPEIRIRKICDMPMAYCLDQDHLIIIVLQRKRCHHPQPIQ